MGTHLSQVSDKPVIKPPRIVIHGKGGVGKTVFAASVPNVLLIPLEEGLGKLTVSHTQRPMSYVDVMNTLAELANEKHDFKAVAIDTVDHLEPLIWNAVCEERSVGKKQYKDIEDWGYGKGYLHSDSRWIDFFLALDSLRANGMTIIVLCHNESKIMEDPLIGPYDRFAPKLHKRANALLYEWADVVGFLDIERVQLEREGAKGRKMMTAQVLGQRILYLEDMGGFVAKNRYDLPPRINIPKDAPYAALRDEIAKALGLTNKKETAAA